MVVLMKKRFTEATYRDLGVFANKFQIVYDLLIKGPNDKDFRNTSVKNDFIVRVSDYEIEYGNVDSGTKQLKKVK